MTNEQELSDFYGQPTDAPITNALIERVMKAFPGVSTAAQAKYYEEVHQELAPLCRDFERELAALRAPVERQAPEGFHDLVLEMIGTIALRNDDEAREFAARYRKLSAAPSADRQAAKAMTEQQRREVDGVAQWGSLE